MKKIIFSLFMMMLCSPVLAGDVEYYNVGGDAKVCSYQFDGEYYIVLSFKDDDDCRLIDGPVLKIKLEDGEVLTLQGSDDSKKTKTHATNWGFGIISGGTSDTHYALFYITRDQIEKLKKGISKIAINTIPEVYKKEFKSDKVGKALYDDFTNMKNEFGE